MADLELGLTYARQILDIVSQYFANQQNPS